MVKKGFTFVELAIVLVVIGIIMGMAIKGKSLIDTAKIRAKMNNITKIESAVAIYMAKMTADGSVTKIPRITGGIYDTATFIDAGLITREDLKIPNNKEWSLWNCDVPYTGGAKFGDGIYTYPNVCIYAFPASNRFFCQVETFRDDKDIKTGAGQAGPAFLGTNMYNFNCDSVNEASNMAYIYKVY